MIMPRLSFEEPKGGPLSKAAQQADDEVEPLAGLLDEEDDDARPAPSRHRQDVERDTALTVMKGFAIALAVALVGVVIVLLTTGGGDKPTAKAPSVPEIGDGDQRSAPATSSVPLGAIVAPQVRSQTTQIVPPPPPPPPTSSSVAQPTVPTEPPNQDQFVRAGDPCDTPGAYAFTERFEPVVCEGRGPSGRLAWRRLFR
jgi:hypothetical protein